MKPSEAPPSSDPTPTTSSGPTADLPPYVCVKPGRTAGKDRYYLRYQGRYVRLTKPPGTAAFAKEYAQALARIKDLAGPVVLAAAPEHTLGWLAAKYFKSPKFNSLDPISQRNRRGIIEDCLRERYNGSPMRDCPLRHVSAAKIRAIRDAKAEAGLMGAANNRRKYLSSLFRWAVEEGHATVNPVRDVIKIDYASAGFHRWTPEEVEQYFTRHPLGTKACLAAALLMLLGVRRSDVVHLGAQQVRREIDPETDEEVEIISFIPRKTRYKRRDEVRGMSYKRILPMLRQIIDASPLGAATFLVNDLGQPFTVAGFGQWFAHRCQEAGLPDRCRAHGLRKAGATLAAENGATSKQLMALYDWTSPAQAEVYTREADRKRLALSAMHLLQPRRLVAAERRQNVSQNRPDTPIDSIDF